MRTVWISLSSDTIYQTESAAWDSGEDFVEGLYCGKCKCVTTTECGCKTEANKQEGKA